MVKKKVNPKEQLADLLHNRIKSLEAERRLYQQNPNLMKNLKFANIELIQGDIARLRNILSGLIDD